ncbi:MAG: MBL fold metallo-hydrolase [Clostridiales bacterium]|nr:MBL fold metallo-hydrolase [Clostridiales bacterium]
MMERKAPPMQKEVTWTDLGNGIYNFSSPPVGFQQYLVLGDKRALLVDTGMGIGSLKNAVEQITDLPVTVINTHGHPDHAGGNAEFGPALMCPAEFDVYERMATREFREGDVSHMPNGVSFVPQLLPTGPAPCPVEDGQIIDLGGRTLKVIYTPGHTHGSICIYDEATGGLFTGDNVQARETALREWNSSTVETFRDSLLRLEALHPAKIMGGHQPNVNEPELLGRVLRCAQAILDGAQGEEMQMRGGGTCLSYASEGVSICYTAENIYND